MKPAAFDPHDKGPQLASMLIEVGQNVDQELGKEKENFG